LSGLPAGRPDSSETRIGRASRADHRKLACRLLNDGCPVCDRTGAISVDNGVYDAGALAAFRQSLRRVMPFLFGIST